jgi:hypothetical protein
MGEEELETDALRRELEIRQEQSTELRNLRDEIYSIVSEHHKRIKDIREELHERGAMDLPVDHEEISYDEPIDILNSLDREYADGIPGYIAVKALQEAGYVEEELVALVDEGKVIENPDGTYRTFAGSGMKSG